MQSTDYALETPQAAPPPTRAPNTSLLTGSALARYQQRASDEGWVRDGGYWSKRAERVRCAGCGERMPATIGAGGRWWTMDDHAPCGPARTPFEDLRLW